jgi:8-oxo-dGTP pyrophosphatase MutT (NUDIX family)
VSTVVYDRQVVDDFEARLRERLTHALPGVEGQLRMAPAPRVGWDPAVVPAGTRDAAGLVLLYPVDRVWHLALTVRAAGLRNHTGQVSLPGGRVDAGESIEDAALREAHEEIGVAPASVRVLGRLTPLHIPVSGHMLHPIVGAASARPAFQRAEQEVARIIEVPVAHLIGDALVHREAQTWTIRGRSTAIEVPYFAIEQERVWGATAMILAELAAIVAP